MNPTFLHRWYARLRQRGQSSVEVLIAMALLAIVSQSVVLIVRTASKQNVGNRDRLFAMEKAVQMLEELRSVVMDQSAQITVLDGTSTYNDGRWTSPGVGHATGDPVLKYTLTTRLDITQPGGQPVADYLTGAAPLSANPQRGNGYVYVRNVEIDPVLNSAGQQLDPNLRKIWVRLWSASPNPGSAVASLTSPTAKDLGSPMAQVYGMVHSLGTGNQPAQVLDMYLLALESVPGWWSRTSNLIPLMNAALVSLQSRNPGLMIRPHWIKTMSFGRDFEYAPEFNQTLRSDTAGVFKKTYIYPGLVQYSDSDDYYYLLDQFSGRLNVDGTLNNSNQAEGSPGVFSQGTMGYPIADQFNHAMRLGDEERIYKTLCAIADNNNVAEPQMSWRQVLERMNNPYHPDFPLFKNSILINLHGEMMPLPPLRNYSDAAKDPDYYWGTKRYDASGTTLPSRAFRVVTHAERLAYTETLGTAVPSDVTLRTYAWDMNPVADPISSLDEADVIKETTLFIPGASTANLKSVMRLVGNSQHSYNWITSTPGTNWVASGGAYSDTGNTSTANWVADNYQPNNRVSGLRIQLHGTTPTARLYVGAPFQ